MTDMNQSNEEYSWNELDLPFSKVSEGLGEW